MSKTQKFIQDHLPRSLAYLLAAAVLVMSLHLKDLVHHREPVAPKEARHHDVSKKATEELHDHVSKQVIKSFAKSVGDTAVLAARTRHDSREIIENDPGIWGRLSEQFLLLGIYLTLPLSR